MATGRVPIESRLQFSPGLRRGVYVGLLIGVFLAMTVGVAVNPSPNPRFLYVLLVSAVCFAPVLWLDRLNGRFFLLAVYMAVHFQYFGFADLMTALVGRAATPNDAVLTESEMIILASLAGVLVGYLAAIGRSPRNQGEAGGKDWPFGIVVLLGTLFWIVGTGCLTYWQTFIITDRSNASLLKNISQLGPWLTTVFMGGQLIQPLSIMILAYAYAVYRRAWLLPMMLIVVGVQLVLGFVADYKSEAMLAGLIVIAVKTYIEGKPPKAWLIGAFLFVMFVFPVFQAYRLEVRGEQGVTSADTLQNLGAVLEKSLEAQTKVKEGFGGAEYRVNSFWERASLKASVDLLADGAGKTVPFQMGGTLTPILTAFLPRVFFPDKESIAVGQIFNKTFHISAVEDTYISPSHVGEVYWNFGWAGTLLLMPAVGYLLGFIGARCAAYPVLSISRQMVMMITIYSFVIRAEGSIATEVVVWMRSIVAIGILHLVFARRTAGEPYLAAAIGRDVGADAAKAPTPFPNLLR